MAVIHETLTLEDKFTNVMTQFLQLGERMSGQLDDIRYSMMNVETATASAAVEMQDMAGRMSQTTTQGASLLTTVRNLAGAFLGMQTVRWLVGTSDQLTQINARLEMITGSAEAAAEANEQIYQAAMRARGSYTDMADLVSQLGTLAPDAFSDTGEIVAFAEQLQKQMALSGTSTMAAQAAMLQLTQGLSSGALRGEELNSVLEQTPMIAQTIADYLGMTTGEMRELASEGGLTAEVVKNAVLGAAEETDAAFEQMPMTWGQVWNQMQNMAIQALDPLLDFINFTANNLDIIAPIVLGVAAAFGVYMVATYGAQVATAAFTAAQAALNAVMSMNPIGLVVIAVILLIAAIYAVTAAVNQFAGTSVSATGIIVGVFAGLFAFVANGAILLINAFSAVGNFLGNVFNDPVAAVKILILDMVTTVLGYISTMAHGIEDLINKIPGVEVSITSGVDALYNRVKGAAEKAKSESEWVEYFKPIEYLDMSETAAAGYTWGKNFTPLGDLFGAGGDLSQYTTGNSPYDEIAGTLGDISGSVKGIEKTVSMSDEDIKALVDVAERRYVNQVNLTSQTPVITVNGANTGRTAQDRRALAEAIEQILLEEWASNSVRSTQYT